MKTILLNATSPISKPPNNTYDSTPLIWPNSSLRYHCTPPLNRYRLPWKFSGTDRKNDFINARAIRLDSVTRVLRVADDTCTHCSTRFTIAAEPRGAVPPLRNTTVPFCAHAGAGVQVFGASGTHRLGVQRGTAVPASLQMRRRYRRLQGEFFDESAHPPSRGHHRTVRKRDSILFGRSKSSFARFFTVATLTPSLTLWV